MRKLFLLLFIISSFYCQAKQTDTIPPAKINTSDTLLPYVPDTINPSSYYKVDQESMSRNLNSLLRYQEERRAKEKRNAIIRIVLGVSMLALLIVGWRRKAKK